MLTGAYVYEIVRLLLLSKSTRYPNGLSNNHGQVGKHYFGHQMGAVSALFPFDSPAMQAAARTYVKGWGAEPLFIDAIEHDAYVAGISHLPFLLSVALMRSVSRDTGWRDMKHLSAGGFRDASRLAAGSPEMHRDICATNRGAITAICCSGVFIENGNWRPPA